MFSFSPKLKNELLKFNQRTLERGDTFLLAKAIADELPLMAPDEENARLFVLNHKRFIDEVLYSICDFTYLGESERDDVCKLIGELSLWRAAVAYNPPSVLFRGDANAVIDDMSLLPRFIDNSYMCAVSDIVTKANYLYDLFRQYAKEIKLSMLEQ